MAYGPFEPKLFCFHNLICVMKDEGGTLALLKSSQTLEIKSTNCTSHWDDDSSEVQEQITDSR